MRLPRSSGFPDPGSMSVVPAPLLEIENLRYRWSRCDDPLLAIPSFKLERRCHLFLMGPSGSGKSTLLNLIGGVIRPQSGAIKFGGNDITALSGIARDRLRANQIGFIFQQFNLVPYLNAVDNVALPCRFSSTRAAKAADRSGSVPAEANRLLSSLFEDGSVNTQQRVDRLSVGQQQRIAAARSLIGDPALVIADEPTSSLDHDSRRRFMSLLLDETERSGSTLLFVSHDPTLSDGFTRVLALNEINHRPKADGTD